MKKTRLHLDELLVESFETTPGEAERGTVFGEQCTCQTACTCPGCPTCYQTCEYTCDDSECIMTCIGDTCGGGGYTCWDSCGYTCQGTCPGWDC
jgi:hypothetical protein